MHGVRKVATTEEQKAAKKKERERKIKVYQTARDRLFDKRHKDQLDEEVLELSEKLLTANPDIYTLWNLRRQVFVRFEQQEKERKCKKDGDEKQDEAEKMEQNAPDPEIPCISTLYKRELSLTEVCLHENPKSYGAWHQRGWVLSRMPEPDFEGELSVCNRALELDERNFHCWDHRRIVCKLAQVSASQELTFSDDKVKDNFSNYSAWHYRSSLLPSLCPDPNGELNVAPSVLNDELSLATNAFYTDPEDQSAWFYTCWLFQANTDASATPILANVDTELNRLCVSFSKAVKLSPNHPVSTNNTPLPGVWSALIPSAKSCHQWLFVPSNPAQCCKSELKIEGYGSISLGDAGDWLIDEFGHHLIGAKPPAAICEALGKQLDDCQQLIEMEPDNKWPVLTATLCMRRLDCQKHEKQIVTNLEKLQSLDKKRLRFYADQLSAFRVQLALLANAKELSLRNVSLTCLPNPHFLCNLRSVNLDANNLKSLAPLKHAVLLEHISAAENQISGFSGLSDLKHLEFLSVASNPLGKASVFEELKKCPKLHRILVCETPIAEVQEPDYEPSEEMKTLFEMFPDPRYRLISMWL